MGALAAACSRPARPAADLVITRANVWTGNARQPTAGAIAIVGDRIVDVGGPDEIEPWRGSTTTVIDAQGRRVLPGFNDAHVHLIDGGTALDNVNLKDADTPAEFARRLGERAKTKPGEWILGGEWDDQRWTPAQLPTRQLIDDITNATPVFVIRYDGHMGLANSTALGRAGITEHTPDPPGGTIVRDAQGFPTGVLKDAAMEFVARVIPKMTPDRRLSVVKRALRYAASVGVTSLQDMNPSYDDIAVYADLANRDELTTRIYAAPIEMGWFDQAKLGIHRSFGSPWLRIGAVKGYADGSLGSTTAYFFQPYTDAPQTRGLLSDEMQLEPGVICRHQPDPHVIEKISVTDAVSAYTSGSAFAEFQEAVKGTIARGKLADVVILSDDVFNIPAVRLKDVQILTTIAGGKVVHQRRP
jgi:predicted amidohydrolase YtcJ